MVDSIVNTPDVALANITTLLRIVLPLILPVAVSRHWIEQDQVVTVSEAIITIAAVAFGFIKNHKAAAAINRAAVLPADAPRPAVPL